MSNVNTNQQQSKSEGASHSFIDGGNGILKIKQILKDIDDEIVSYEKAVHSSEEHVKFLKGHVSGLRRSKTALEIYFVNDLKQEVPNA